MEQEVRRLKRLFKDPNPLFTSWLTEWKEEAARKDTNMKYVYGTALKSLRQYPLPLTSGKSCNILKGFGVTLCARLDERLRKHIELHGPLPALSIQDQVELGGPKLKSQSKKRTPKLKSPKVLQEPHPQLLNGPVFPQSQADRRASGYRPKAGSGGFALLVALRRQEQKPGYDGFMHKAALQEAAQPLCGASMTLPEAGGYYTAWSTMTTLVKRKLVHREGSPARFSLTAAGRQLADQLEAAPSAAPSRWDCFDRLAGSCPGDPPPPPGPTGTGRQPSPDTECPSAGAGANRAPLLYQYVSSDGNRVQRKDDAHVSLQDGRVGFLVRCRQDALRSRELCHWPDPTRPERDGEVHVFLSDSDCAELCPGPTAVPGGAGPSRKLHDMSDSDGDSEQPMPSQAQSHCRPHSQSLSRSPLRVGTALKRQPTDWKAALKRLRSDIASGSLPAASTSTSGSTASRTSSQGAAGPLIDEDVYLLSDDDDVVTLPAPSGPPPRLSPSAGVGSEGDVPLTRPVHSATSRRAAGPAVDGPVPSASAEAAGRPAPTASSVSEPGTAARGRTRPPTAAERTRELAAAAAEARAGRRPPPAPAETATSDPPCGSGTPDGGSPARSVPAPAADGRDFTPSLVLPPGTFDVVLCVDNQETSGKTSAPGALLQSYRDVVLDELQKNGVVADVRKLSVGDFLWVARPRTGRQPDELVLPYVVERKRLDDLASSIRDNRYREQKFRLKRCGLPNVIYLAEAMGTGPRAKSVRLPESTLQQALANCQVVDGFRVKWTADQRETAAFLTLMTRRLQRQYQDRQLEGCPRSLLPASPQPPDRPERLQLFSEFHQLSAKRQRLTAGDVFAKMLLQLSGLSVDKAAAVLAVYPTMARLLEAYGRCGSPAEAEGLLASLRTEKSGRPVGAAVSRAVYHLYCDRQLL